ncbi:MAG TPA: cobalt-precorrin 5A hydrolase [Oscillospiraceae bacterium]|nr:cobalt-precorrin 5A hydrolase [Oscillospiraceae bacterium]
MSGAVVALTPRGRELALCLKQQFNYSVYLPHSLLQPDDQACPYTALRVLLPDLFRQQRKLVLIMAVGIAVRLLAPYLQSKQQDPAVVVLDEHGRFAISLLSGHLGGANALAQQLAQYLEGTAVITTATDGAGLRAVDVIAHQFGLTPEPVSRVKELNAAMLRGEPVTVFTDWPVSVFGEAAGLSFQPLAQLKTAQGQPRAVLTHCQQLPGMCVNELLLRPKNLYVGVGCRRGVAAERIEAAVKTVLKDFNLAAASLAQLASIEQKRDEAGLLTAAYNLKVPIRFFNAAEIQAVQYDYEKSKFVEEIMGVGSVCVPTAILAAQSSKLLVPKQKLDQITIAVAEDESPWLASDRVMRLS